jgi:hypothetical protein
MELVPVARDDEAIPGMREPGDDEQAHGRIVRLPRSVPGRARGGVGRVE